MCGIWASFGLDVSTAVIDRVAHRGPDGQGWRTFQCTAGPVALGHRRLAIIDTRDEALQPMADASGRYWLVFNGEIYNYLELRQELAAEGVVFRTLSDSEVLLQALIRWGTAALPRLFGMFAFALWDDQVKTLTIARDRFGIKPLYVAVTPNGVAVASEIKQLHDLPGLPRRMNLARVRDFLAYGLMDHTDETLFEGIGQVAGGHCAVLHAARWRPGTAREIVPWYQLAPRPAQSAGLAAEAERYRELFSDAVRLHLRSDVTVGSCLSGGLDSSSIVMEASRQLGPTKPMATVSAFFDVPRVDERSYIEAVTKASGAQARYVTFASDDVFRTAEKAIWHQDEPFGSTSILAQWFVYAGARDAGIKVMLDGQGADEPLAGYHWMFPPALAQYISRGQFSDALRQVSERRTVHGAGVGRQVIEMLPYLGGRLLLSHARKFKRGLAGRDWLDGPALRPFAAQPDPFAPALGGLSEGPLDFLMRTMTTSTSVPMLLHWQDRNSMAHGIEARVPFLDHRLVELAMDLGAQHKMVGACTKVVLREAMKGLVPPAVLSRQDKLGFATPEQEWLRGSLAAPMRQAVLDTLDLYPTLLNRQGTLALIDAMQNGRLAANFAVWRIASIGIWGRLFGLGI
jgi:asparagine synthase (glutamine-hydrolysing)